MAWLIARPFIAELKLLGYEVHLACRLGEYETELRTLGVTLHHVDVSRTFNPFAHIPALRQLWKLRHTIQFASVNAHGVLAGLLWRTATFFERTPTLYYVQGFYFHDDMPRPLAFAIQLIERILGRKTTLFVFVSREDEQTARRVGIVKRHQPAIVSPNGVDIDTYVSKIDHPGQAVQARASLGFEDSETVIGIVGRVVREKGHGEFLAMAEALCRTRDDLRFLVVGDSLATDRDQYAPVLKAMVADKGLRDKFRFVGFVNDVHRHMLAMDVFVLPTYREGFPVALLQAMATGVPVVTTDVRGCREAVEDNQTGLLVPPRNAERLTEAVGAILADPALAARLAKAGRACVEANFTRAHVLSRFRMAMELMREHSKVQATSLNG